jgi:hypothetical protein
MAAQPEEKRESLDLSQILSKAEFQELERAIQDHLATLRNFVYRSYVTPAQTEHMEWRLRVSVRMGQLLGVNCEPLDLDTMLR